MAFPIDTPAEMIGQLYVGYFGRAADPDGLNYWITQFNAGMSLQAIANSFAVQPEATALYSYLAAPEVGDPAAFVTAIYQDLFNRGPDAGGLAYWVNQLTVQGTPPGQMVLNIISGAQGSDKTTIENKTHVAVNYAEKFVDNNLTWIGIDNIQGARDVVTPVTSDPATVVTAILQIDGIITQELTNPQNIQLTPNLATIPSGGTVAITLKADPSQASKDFQFTITGVDSSVVKGGQLSGTVKLGSDSTAVINVGTVVTAAQLNTPNETIKVTVGPISTNVGLTEGTQVVTQTGPVNEGNSFNFTVTTSGIAAGSANGLVQTWTITGPGLAHIPVAERSGTVTLDNNGVATVTVHTLATLPDSGTTSVTIAVGNDAPVNVVINETAVQTITPSAAAIQEGAQVIFKVTTTGVAGSAVAGQVENWTLSGLGAGQINGPLSGTVTLDQDGTATVTVSTLVNDLNDLSPANLVFTLLSGAVPVGTATVGINQGTQVTTNTGPVNEGTAFSFTVATSGVAPGSVEGRIESYTLTGPGIDHIPVAERSGIVTLDAAGNATITVNTLADLANPGGTSTVSIQVGNNVASTVTINEVAQQSVSTSAGTILEGGSVVFTINTAGVLGSSVAGQVETWTLSGAAASQVTGPLSGTVTLDSNGSATVTIATHVDQLNDGLLKDLVFTLNSGATQTAQATVNVSQGTQVTTAPSAVVEGGAFTFEVTTTGVAPGSAAGRIEAYTISGPGLAQIPAAERSGTVVLDANGHASVTVHTLVDLGVLGFKPINIQVGNNAPVTLDILDQAFQTVNVSPASADINQGQSVTFTINTLGVAGSSVAGMVQSWTLTGSGTNQVTGGVLSGTVTLDANGSAVVTVGTDFSIINGPLTQNLRFELNSGGSAVLSPIVTIHESTLTVTPPALPVVEGNQVTFTITGVNIPNGSTYSYTLSGEAIGNVVPTSQIDGTVTINNNTATVVVNTFSNDISGINKGLTLTVDQVPTAKGTALISETAPSSFILTTGTDNFTGNPAGDNTFFAVASSTIFTTSSTLGQNDTLNGNSNVAGHPNTLFLQTTGLFPQLINAFTTNDIQVFNINPGQDGAGTTIDMSSVFGMTKVINSNASGKLTLLNVTQATDVELVNPSDIFPGTTVDMAVQYQNNPAKPATQNLLLDPTVSPITGLPNSRFWVNVDKVTITSSGPGTNGLLSVNGATNGFGPTALTTLTLLGSTNFVAGTDGSGQKSIVFTNAGVASSANTLDLSAFNGVFFDVGDPDDFSAISAVGGLTILSGAGGMDGTYVPAPGFTGAAQGGGGVDVGGNLLLQIAGGNVSNQAMSVVGNITAQGNPFGSAAGGLLDSLMFTFGLGSSQTYDGFDGGLTGDLRTNNGFLGIGTSSRVDGVIDVSISTGTGQAVIIGGNGNVTLDFSGAGTTGFHQSLQGGGTEDRFIGGTALNTLIFDPMINNMTNPNGEGLARGVQVITLQSPANTPWGGTQGGTGGVRPTNTVSLGLLNQNAAFDGTQNDFAQTININGPLTGVGTGQTFEDAVSNDVFVLDNSRTAVSGGSMHGQVMAFDFSLPTASNVLNFTANNVNANGGLPQLFLRDFEISSAAAGQQNPITTANLQMNRSAGAQNVIFTTLDNLDRLTTLNLSGTSNRFNDGFGLRWIVIGTAGAQTLTTITGTDQNYDLLTLTTTYQSTVGGTITLGNGVNLMGANAGNWTITSGLVPGGGTAGDSGNNLVSLSPQLGNLHTVKTGGGNDTFEIGFNLAPGGGRVDIMSGAGEDTFFWIQSGIFPNLNSAQKVDGGTGRDTFVLFDGAINENDSLFGQITNTEIFVFADGTFNNSLLLNFFANGSGLDTIITRGFGSSNVIFEGTGFTNRMRYEIATQFDGGGDSGHDAIIVQALPSGSNAITVATTTGGFNIAFESGLMTNAINPGTGLITQSGIFANPNAADTLELTADGLTATVFALGGFGTHSVETILGKSGGAGVSQTIWLVSDPALGTGVTTVDLSAVQGNTTVWAQGSTLGETITGGKAGTNILFGGLAADTIKAQGTAAGFGTNFIWGGGDFTGGAQDVETGVQGGADNNVGTVFYIDSVAESPGGPFDPAFDNRDVHITNFHVATDTLLINPGALLYGDIPVFLGDALDYGNALALLAGGNAGFTQAVYQLDDKAMWIDANHDGLLNQLDIRVFIDFASPGFQPGSINFGNLIGVFNGAQATAYKDAILNPASTVPFSGTLLPGEFLFGSGPGNNDKLTLSDGNVANGILVGFEKLEIASGAVGTLSINQWNSFWPQITGPGFNAVNFLDGIDASKGTSMMTIQAIESYNFWPLSYGITLTTQGFLGGPVMGAGTVLGTNFDDTFNVNENDLKNAFMINGNGGTDTLNVDVNLIFGGVFGATGVAGTTNAGVTDVEILNLIGPGPNTVGFNPGTAFNIVNGGDGVDRIIDPENLAGNWTLNLGESANVVQINATDADISPGTLTVVGGGSIGLNINAAAPSNTRMNFAEYSFFFEGGIALTNASTFANTTITFSDRAFGPAFLDPAVGIWVFQSTLSDVFFLLAQAQSVDVNAGGGADAAILNLPGDYTGTFAGSADDTIALVPQGAPLVLNLSGINGGGATTFGILSFFNSFVFVSMTTVQHNAFAVPFSFTAGTQTVTLTTGGAAAGDAGIENYFLVGGAGNAHSFEVFKDGATLQGGKQNVTVTSGGAQDIIKYGTGTFTGNLTGLLIADNDIVEFTGNNVNSDISGVNGGAVTGANTLSFNSGNVSATMTTAQHEGFVKPFINTLLTQTVTLTTGGTAVGDFAIEHYILVGGAGKAHTFTAAPNTGSLATGKQDVTVTAGGAQDTIRYGAGIFTGNLLGLLVADNDIVQFFDNADIKGVNGGAATGARTADFSDATVTVTMTFAQHNGFTQPFTQTAGNQAIKLFDSGTAMGDGGIDTYFLNTNGVPANDIFTLAKDDGVFEQSVDFGGGDDIAVFGAGTFTGNMTNVGAGDTTKFVGDADIKGVNVGFSIMDKVDFNDQAVSVTMTAAQHNGFTQPFGKTANTQTITLTSALAAVIIGDAGIENYALTGNGPYDFTVTKDNGSLVGGKQNVVATGGAAGDLIKFGPGTFTGNVVGLTGLDSVVFTGGIGVVTDIKGVNGGASLGGIADFNSEPSTVTMTVDQHQSFLSAGSPFLNTDGGQTIVLSDSGVILGDTGIENYFLASGDDTFFVAPDFGPFKQNVDISSGGDDIIVYGAGTFKGKLVGGGAGDTVQFFGGTTDVSGLNGGAVMGPKAVSFSNVAVDVSMTVVQHNDFSRPFSNTGNGGGTQTITLTTDGVATGDIGIEQYVLGEDGQNTNVFTVGIIGQNVTGRNDNDTVINPFGGVSGVLKGGSNTATGDTLILQGANTTLAAGSGEFENLTLTVVNGTVTSDTAAHNGFTGVIDAPGTNNYTVNDDDGGTLTGLMGFESYAFVSTTTGFEFTLTDSQTGTITGSGRDDTITATASQVAGVVKIDGGAEGDADALTITTDAAGLNLNDKTTDIEFYNLEAGSTANVFASNVAGITVFVTGSAIFTMGSAAEFQAYVGGSGAKAGIDHVTFSVGSTLVFTEDGNDTVVSLVGGAITETLNGGAGFDTLSLTNNDDLSGAAGVTKFEDLLLANNASVRMTGAQYNQFTTNSQALGTNTIIIEGAAGSITTSTFAGVENYILNGNAPDHTYTIAGSNQTITDNDSSGITNATLISGLSNVTITATAGVTYGVTALLGGANLAVTTGDGTDVVNLAGGHTGVDISMGVGFDVVGVTGSVAGTIDAGPFVPGGSKLDIHDTADISGATVINFGDIYWDNGASATLSAATWDQYVGTNGQWAAGHRVLSAEGVETATLSTTTTNVTTALTAAVSNKIENYVLSSAADDFFRVNNGSTTFHASVDLSGGGSDFVVLNDTNAAVTGNLDLHTTTLAFTGGAGGDVLQVQLAANSISSGTAIIVTAMDTDVTSERTIIVNSFAGATMTQNWSQASARTAVDFAIDQIEAGTYTVAVQFSGGGQSGVYVMAMTTAADNPGAAVYDLIGVLSNTNVNTLTGANFT